MGRPVKQVLCAMEAVLVASPDAPIRSTPSSVKDLLAVGEDVVAYEILRDNLCEIDVRPPADLGLAVRQAAVDSGADSRRADLLIG